MSLSRITPLLFAPAVALVAPAMAQEAAMGEIAVDATLEDATVYIDYEEVGKTPLQHRVPPGRYNVRVAIDGFQPFVRSVDVHQDEVTEVNATLIAGPGSVEFVVQPSGAAVVIDGRQAGTAPIRLADIGQGSHEYTLSAPSHETVEGSFDFEIGQNLLIVHELEDISGQFRFETDPSGAALYFDGEFVGVSPMTLEDVDPDVHLVRAELKGHGTVLRAVDTIDGGPGEFSARLDSRHATQVFSGGQPDTVWTVDGQQLGEGSSMKLGLDRGTYKLRVETPGYKTVDASFIAGDSGRETWKVLLEPDESYEGSELVERAPLYKNWIFWTAVGVAATGGGVGAAVALQPEDPEPLPSGDVAVSLP